MNRRLNLTDELFSICTPHSFIGISKKVSAYTCILLYLGANLVTENRLFPRWWFRYDLSFCEGQTQSRVSLVAKYSHENRVNPQY